MTPPVAVNGMVRVCAEKCSTCIFRPGNLMHLQPGRVKEMTDQARATDGSIVCHQTLDRDEGAICRGYFDSYADENWMLRLAKGLDRVMFIDPASQPEAGD